jgi:hypothetical protein
LIFGTGQGYYPDGSQHLSRSGRPDAGAGFVARSGFLFSSVISFHERLTHLFAKPSTQGGDGMEPKGFHRKLTAILSADVAGYSRLMQDDETATVKTLESYKQVFFDLIKQHRGRVVDSPGDNLLAEFASVVDAVQCAVAVQKEFHAHNAELPENRRMRFRIGVNLGDVIEEGERIYGDGVNIAARDGSHIWAKRYDHQLEDLFALQDRITMEVMEALNVKFLPGVTETNLSISLKQYRPNNLKAYEAYL